MVVASGKLGPSKSAVLALGEEDERVLDEDSDLEIELEFEQSGNGAPPRQPC